MKDYWNEQFQAAESGFKDLLPDEPTEEQVLTAADALKKKGINPAAISKKAKELYKVGIRASKLKSSGVEKGEKTAEKTVDKIVEKEIAAEAAGRVRTVLTTGKDLEKELGSVARHYGFESTADFILGMFEFWDLWHDKVPELVREREEYRWALREVLRSMAPEVKEKATKEAIYQFAKDTMIASQISGNPIPADEMFKHLQNLKEMMKD